MKFERQAVLTHSFPLTRKLHRGAHTSVMKRCIDEDSSSCGCQLKYTACKCQTKRRVQSRESVGVKYFDPILETLKSMIFYSVVPKCMTTQNLTILLLLNNLNELKEVKVFQYFTSKSNNYRNRICALNRLGTAARWWSKCDAGAIYAHPYNDNMPMSSKYNVYLVS